MPCSLNKREWSSTVRNSLRRFINAVARSSGILSSTVYYKKLVFLKLKAKNQFWILVMFLPLRHLIQTTFCKGCSGNQKVNPLTKFAYYKCKVKLRNATRKPHRNAACFSGMICTVEKSASVWCFGESWTLAVSHALKRRRTIQTGERAKFRSQHVELCYFPSQGLPAHLWQQNEFWHTGFRATYAAFSSTESSNIMHITTAWHFTF